MREVFERSLADAARLLSDFRSDPDALDALVAAADAVRSTFRAGGKLLVCGNGGSMADAMHFAEEWSGRFRKDRRPYPAIALSDPAHMSCVANDFGFDFVFSRQVEALGRPGDLLAVLSTSGASANLIEAARAARMADVRVLGILGRDGGPLLELCDLVVMTPGDTSDRIQELQMLSLHILIEAVEIEIGHA